jgi:hypothetical protein
METLSLRAEQALFEPRSREGFKFMGMGFFVV